MGQAELRAYHGDPGIKSGILAQLQAHAEADELVKGQYWEDGKGCAVGCTIHGSDHALYEPRFGIPAELAHLEDSIFEGLPAADAKEWPIRFMGAIQPGADLSRVRWQFLHWLLTDETVNPGINHDLVKDAVTGVADLCLRAALGEPVTDDDWSAAAAASAAAAWSAARSARSAAWSAADAAAWSAARSARSAAWSARSAAWSAASAAASWKSMADKLIELVAAAAGETA